jgi:hypothetical protein
VKVDSKELSEALRGICPTELATDLVSEFLQLRQDYATRTLGRAAPGKFVETVVQIMQFWETGRYESKPDVDRYLREVESRTVPFDDGLKICAARIARSMYSLRNKRNILHKGSVDPNEYDLAFLVSASQWILAELVRLNTNVSMQQAGKIVEAVSAPVGGLVEDFGGRKIVLPQVSIDAEILLLLRDAYPSFTRQDAIVASLNRRSAGSVANSLRRLWRSKLIDGDKKGYKLTQKGFQQAIELVRIHVA